MEQIDQANAFIHYGHNYLNAAETLCSIENRRIGFWFPCYYLLSHSLELAVKGRLLKSSVKIVRTHNILDLARKNIEILGLSHNDIEMIAKLGKLNVGAGGLRYPNPQKEKFTPDIFDANAAIVRRLLSGNNPKLRTTDS